ncbi:cation transporter dimerization domain-containing protein, partial [Gilvimarinus sp. 1_MG-2023]
DQAMPEAEETELHQLIKGVDGVRGFHDMKTRQAGAVQFIQFHLDMDGDQTLNRAHAIGDQVEAAILARFPRAEVLIHHDPV